MVNFRKIDMPSFISMFFCFLLSFKSLKAYSTLQCELAYISKFLFRIKKLCKIHSISKHSVVIRWKCFYIYFIAKIYKRTILLSWLVIILDTKIVMNPWIYQINPLVISIALNNLVTVILLNQIHHASHLLYPLLLSLF